MRFNPVSTVAFEECYCLIWESGIIGQPCEWGPVEQWGRDPSPNLINTLWAENKSVIWPAFNAHWLTVYSALLPVKYLFMSGEGNRVSGRKIQRKANSEKRWNSETSSAAQLCVKEERDAVFLWGVLGLSDDLLTPHPPRIPSYTCSPLWHTLLIQIMTSISQLFPLERYTSAALCYKTKSHPCMLLTCSTHIGVHSWQRQHLVDENVTAGTGQQNVEIMFTHVAQHEYHGTMMFKGQN